MKEFFSRTWLSFVGAGSTLSFKSISAQINPGDIMEHTEIIYQTHSPMWEYFVIGILGALGGLIVRLLWCWIKIKYPKLKKLDS